MFGIFKKYETIEKLNILEKKLQSSRLNGAKKCSRSGFCCFKRPAIPTPDEVEQLAKHFKKSPKEFINAYCTIDQGLAGESYYPKFAGLNSKSYIGKFLISDASWEEGACIFLSEKLPSGKYDCTIYNIKPKMCENMKCWEPPVKSTLLNEWNDNTLLTRFGIDGEQLYRQSSDSWM